VRGTKNVEQATGGLQMALDISAATGKDLTTVSEALSMAYQGNMRGLRSLSPEMAKLIKEGADLDTVMSVLGGTFGGAMAENAATAEGRMRRFGVAIENAQENIGYALLPVIEATLPFLEKLGMLAQEHTTTFVIAAGVIGGLAAAILVMNAAIKAYVVITKVAAAAQAALNFVLTANPIGVVVMAIAALVAGLVLAYNKSETFRNAVNAMFNGIKTAITASVDFIKGYLNTVMTFYKTIFNGIATAWNSTVGKLSFRAPDWIPGIGGRGFDVPDIPMLASGGIVTRPTMAILGEAGPEAVVPLDRMRGMGTVTVNVNGGLATSAEIGEAVVNAIRQYNQVQGPANIAVA
jgi:phage-related protein